MYIKEFQATNNLGQFEHSTNIDVYRNQFNLFLSITGTFLHFIEIKTNEICINVPPYLLRNNVFGKSSFGFTFISTNFLSGFVHYGLGCI